MYPLSGPAGENEYDASEPEPEVQVAPGEFLTWFVRLATVGYLAGLTVRIVSDEEIRLRLMHLSIRLLQTTARVFGGWALKTEKNYNEYVDTLH